MKFNQAFFAGGVYCLDFCNTFDHRNDPVQFDFFPDRATVVDWGRAHGTFPKKVGGARETEKISMEKVRLVRKLIFRIFDPFTRSGRPARSDLAALDAQLRATAAEYAIVPAGRGYRRICTAEDPALRVVCEALRSASDLLVSDKLDRIRKCTGCGWIFFDHSRNGSRKWCTMKICGNRAKAHRHYQKHKTKHDPSH